MHFGWYDNCPNGLHQFLFIVYDNIFCKWSEKHVIFQRRPAFYSFLKNRWHVDPHHHYQQKTWSLSLLRACFFLFTNSWVTVTFWEFSGSYRFWFCSQMMIWCNQWKPDVDLKPLFCTLRVTVRRKRRKTLMSQKTESRCS